MDTTPTHLVTFNYFHFSQITTVGSSVCVSIL